MEGGVLSYKDQEILLSKLKSQAEEDGFEVVITDNEVCIESTLKKSKNYKCFKIADTKEHTIKLLNQKLPMTSILLNHKKEFELLNYNKILFNIIEGGSNNDIYIYQIYYIQKNEEENPIDSRTLSLKDKQLLLSGLKSKFEHDGVEVIITDDKDYIKSILNHSNHKDFKLVDIKENTLNLLNKKLPLYIMFRNEEKFGFNYNKILLDITEESDPLLKDYYIYHIIYIQEYEENKKEEKKENPSICKIGIYDYIPTLLMRFDRNHSDLANILAKFYVLLPNLIAYIEDCNKKGITHFEIPKK